MTTSLPRRMVLAGAGAAGLIAAADASATSRAAEAAPHESFSFLFITDAHIQPELDAAHGCREAFAKARRIGGDFVIQGGDHVFDALGVGRTRAADLMSLYLRTEQDLALKVHHTIGNHDLLGIHAKSGVAPTDPLYGKKYFEDRFGRLYYAFDHRGVHFVVLDSIGVVTDPSTGDHDYEGRIDAAQVSWLKADLDALPPGTPIVVVSHVPLVTAFGCYGDPNPKIAEAAIRHQLNVANSGDILPLFHGRNVLGVLQGHTHINETVLWQGVPFITGGAVSGNWWHGTHLGTPEGFTVVTVANNRLTTRYETYGFHSVDPHNT